MFGRIGIMFMIARYMSHFQPAMLLPCGAIVFRSDPVHDIPPNLTFDLSGCWMFVSLPDNTCCVADYAIAGQLSNYGLQLSVGLIKQLFIYSVLRKFSNDLKSNK